MRTETITKTYLNFNELNDTQKLEVLRKNRCIHTDYDWWTDSTEELEKDLESLGFVNASIAFSGFYSQGDGASFTCDKFDAAAFHGLSDGQIENLSLSSLRDKDNFKAFEALVAELSIEEQENFKIERIGRYAHCNSMILESSMSAATSRLFETAKELADSIYHQLEMEYDYLTSDEVIIETIESNEYEFDADTLEIV